MLFDCTLFLEAHKTLYVTIAITQLFHSSELMGRESGAPSPRVHLDGLTYYLTFARMVKWQWWRRLISVGLYWWLI